MKTVSSYYENKFEYLLSHLHITKLVETSCDIMPQAKCESRRGLAYANVQIACQLVVVDAWRYFTFRAYMSWETRSVYVTF